MDRRRVRAPLAALLWLAACGSGGPAVPPDPCAAAGVCTSPPADACSPAGQALHHPASGICTGAGGAAQCAYPPAPEDCGAAGKVCLAGACVAPDPCALPVDGAGFLAYAASNGTDYDLRAVRLDGSCDQPLAAGPGDDLRPSWSASAGLLVWGGVRGGNARVVVLSLADGLQRVLDTGDHLALAPALSPDATTVVYEDVTASTASELYAVPVGGGVVPVRVVGHTASEWDSAPVFSPEGTWLYFVRSTLGGANVWRVPPGGGVAQQVTFVNDVQGTAAVSADGHLLAYTRFSASGSKVVLHALSPPLEPDRVLSDHGDSEPAFPAGGGLVAVRTTRYGLTDIVLLDLASGDVAQRLTDGARLVGTPAFPR